MILQKLVKYNNCKQLLEVYFVLQQLLGFANKDADELVTDIFFLIGQ